MFENNEKLLENFDKIDEICEQFDNLKEQFEDYKKNNDEIIESYNKMFNILMIDHKLQPRGTFKKLQDICRELLDFVANICYKYDLHFWLDAGTLLGAVRHDGFIPWDDELDIAMCRKDIDAFWKVLHYEVEEHNLADVIEVRRDFVVSKTWILSYIQLSIYPEPYRYLTHIDIFPYDFIDEVDDEMIKLYEEEKYDFHIKLINGMPREDVEKDHFKKVNVSYDYQKYLIPAVESRRSSFEPFPLVPLKSDLMFPLKTIEFCGKYYYCPNNSDYFLKTYWEDYGQLPKIIESHNMLDNMKKIPNINEYYQKYIDLLKEVNEKFITKIGANSLSYVTIPLGFGASDLTNHSVVLKNETSSYTLYEFPNKSIKSIFEEYYNTHKNDRVTENVVDINGITVRGLNLEVNGEFIHTNYFYVKNGITYQIYPSGEFNQRIFKNLIVSTNKII